MKRLLQLSFLSTPFLVAHPVGASRWSTHVSLKYGAPIKRTFAGTDYRTNTKSGCSPKPISRSEVRSY